MKRHRRCIVITGGGTGGHVYPALAIAEECRTYGLEPVFIGTASGLEARVVPEAGYRLYTISASGLLRKGIRDKVLGVLRVAGGFAQAYALLRRLRPIAVIGTGGFVTGPVGLAAAALRIPLAVLEANVVAGFTNRLLMRFACRIFVPFDKAKTQLPARLRDRARVFGNPLRGSLLHASRNKGRETFGIAPDAFVLLVVGGSLGGARLNAVTAAAVDALGSVHVLWITGPRYHARYADLQSERVHVFSYLDNLELALAAADLVLCRAGAMTISELTARGLPALLVPSPNVAEDHQSKNAAVLGDAGAAHVIGEAQLDAETMVREVTSLMDDPEQRARMAEASRNLGRPHAAQSIVREVLQQGRLRT